MTKYGAGASEVVVVSEFELGRFSVGDSDFGSVAARAVAQAARNTRTNRDKPILFMGILLQETV